MYKLYLNSGRNCLKYIVKLYKITEINIPYYICPVVWQILRQENVHIKFYHIDKNFMPLKNFTEKDYILYPNYFGICDEQKKILAQKYKNLILDNAHAFFTEYSGLASFSSPRKFFKNLNDGGILYCNKKLNEIFEQDFDRSITITDYNSFCKNELSIDNQPIKIMSKKTRKELEKIDFNLEIKKRENLFYKIHSKIGKDNKLIIMKHKHPYVYPYVSENSGEIAEILNKNNIYLVNYGPKLPKEFCEFNFFNNLLMIPLTNKINTIWS